MAEMSVQVTNQIKNGTYIISSFETQGETVAQDLVSKLTGSSKAENYQALKNLAMVLKKETETLEKIELAYISERSDDEAPRLAREEAVTNGQRVYASAIHRILSIQNTEDLLRKYGLSTAQPSNPNKLHTILKNAGALLLQETETYQDEFAQEMDPKKIGSLLQKSAVALEKALTAVTRERRELQEILVKRNDALEQWGEVYQSVASALEGYFRLAGHKELAARIRPTSRRRRGEVSPSEPIASEPTPSEPTNTPT